MDLVVVFIVSSFREVPGWCPAKKSSSNIRLGEPEEERPMIRAWMRVQIPPLFFYHFFAIYLDILDEVMYNYYCKINLVVCFRPL